MPIESEAKASGPTPHLTEAYQKARRNLTFASGILLAWEYVGVEIGKSSAELPVAKTPVNLQNPEVLPQVICLIVLYFASRVGIEWCQCDPERRTKRASKLDLSIASLLAAMAISLYIFQTLYNIRVASNQSIFPLFIMTMTGSSFGVAAHGIKSIFLIQKMAHHTHRMDTHSESVDRLRFVLPTLAFGILGIVMSYPWINIESYLQLAFIFTGFILGFLIIPARGWYSSKKSVAA